MHSGRADDYSLISPANLKRRLVKKMNHFGMGKGEYTHTWLPGFFIA